MLGHLVFLVDAASLLMCAGESNENTISSRGGQVGASIIANTRIGKDCVFGESSAGKEIGGNVVSGMVEEIGDATSNFPFFLVIFPCYILSLFLCFHLV